jgi:uncharacterized RDD family membrane protein YckC
MQPVTVQEQVEYASLGWRFTAVLIDTVVLLGLWIIVLMVYIFVLAGQGKIDPNDPAAAQQLSQEIGGSGVLNVALLGSLFIYYAVLEAIFSASIGKLVCRMRVVMADGSRATGLAVVVRNVIRVPEAIFFYVPSGISCAVSPRRQRLGDHAARTLVVRRRMTVTAPGAPGAAPGAPPYGAPPSGPPVYGAPVPPAPIAPQAHPQEAAWPAAEPAVPAGPPPLAEALQHLKTAALASRGAHLNYLRFSERELAAGADDPARSYSEEYVSAWFTLTDAVVALRTARDDASASAGASGQTLEEVCAAQPDLAHLLRELTPYFTADGDEGIHEAFLAVARSEESSS